MSSLGKNPQVLVFDPILTKSEKDILRKLKIESSEENKEGCYSIYPGKSTIFYLPHCPKQLLNNILWTNWEKLDEILILGNSISEIVASLSQNQLKTVHYLQLASELCKGN